MKQVIHIFKNGAVLTNEETENVFDIDGYAPLITVSATEKNIKKYFPSKKLDKK